MKTSQQRRSQQGSALAITLVGGALIGTLPMLLLYFVGQKYFVQGLARTGLKG